MPSEPVPLGSLLRCNPVPPYQENPTLAFIGTYLKWCSIFLGCYILIVLGAALYDGPLSGKPQSFTITLTIE
jgi:hypothetical protein